MAFLKYGYSLPSQGSQVWTFSETEEQRQEMRRYIASDAPLALKELVRFERGGFLFPGEVRLDRANVARSSEGHPQQAIQIQRQAAG